MKRFRALVRVRPGQGVLDPQGQAVAAALRALGFAGVEDVRVGRWIEVELQAGSADAARAAAEEMCRRLLANPVLEEYAVDVVEVGGEPPGPARGGAGAPPAVAGLGSPLNPGAAARGLGAPVEGAVQGTATQAPARGVPPAGGAGSPPMPGSPGLPPVPGDGAGRERPSGPPRGDG